jgi:hypothetical protein
LHPAWPYPLNVYKPPSSASGALAARNTDRILSSRCYAGAWLVGLDKRWEHYCVIPYLTVIDVFFHNSRC